MKKLHSLILSLAALTLLWGCGDDKITPPISGDDDAYATRGLYIVNEGSFGKDVSSISFLDLESGKLTNEVYEKANSAFIGQGAQSLTVIDDLAYIAVSNLDQVKVLDAHTGKDKVQYKIDAPSPRYVTAVSKSKIYISSLYTSTITVVDRSTNLSAGVIDLGMNPRTGKVNSSEHILVVGKYAYVNNWSYGDQIIKIDTETDKVVSTLQVGYQPNSMTLDKNGKLWVASDGEYDEGFNKFGAGAICRINLDKFGADDAIEQEFKFESITTVPRNLTINDLGNELYFTNNAWGGAAEANGIYKMKITDSALPAIFIKQESKTFYGFNIDPTTGELFVTDALDYSQAGMLYKYSAAGVMLDEYRVGIVPGGLSFKAKKAK